MSNFDADCRVCPRCLGSGTFNVIYSCPDCSGRGWIPRKQPSEDVKPLPTISISKVLEPSDEFVRVRSITLHRQIDEGPEASDFKVEVLGSYDTTVVLEGMIAKGETRNLYFSDLILRKEQLRIKVATGIVITVDGVITEVHLDMSGIMSLVALVELLRQHIN